MHMIALSRLSRALLERGQAARDYACDLKYRGATYNFHSCTETQEDQLFRWICGVD